MNMEDIMFDANVIDYLSRKFQIQPHQIISSFSRLQLLYSTKSVNKLINIHFPFESSANNIKSEIHPPFHPKKQFWTLNIYVCMLQQPRIYHYVRLLIRVFSTNEFIIK